MYAKWNSTRCSALWALLHYIDLLRLQYVGYSLIKNQLEIHFS